MSILVESGNETAPEEEVSRLPQDAMDLKDREPQTSIKKKKKTRKLSANGKTGKVVLRLARIVAGQTSDIWRAAASNKLYHKISKDGKKRKLCVFPKKVMETTLIGASQSVKHQLAFDLKQKTGCSLTKDEEAALNKPWNLTLETGCNAQMYHSLVAFQQQLAGLALLVASEMKNGIQSSKHSRISGKAVRVAIDALHSRAAHVSVPFLASSKIIDC